MSDARRRAEEALALPGDDPVRKWAVFGCLHQMISEIGEEKALRSLLAEAPAPPAPDEVREAAFARFGRALLPKWWDDGNPGDIDGGDAQEAAEACGLWHHVERHSDDVECEWCGNDGSPCGELTEVGLSALAARGGA